MPRDGNDINDGFSHGFSSPLVPINQWKKMSLPSTIEIKQSKGAFQNELLCIWTREVGSTAAPQVTGPICRCCPLIIRI